MGFDFLKLINRCNLRDKVEVPALLPLKARKLRVSNIGLLNLYWSLGRSPRILWDRDQTPGWERSSGNCKKQTGFEKWLFLVLIGPCACQFASQFENSSPSDRVSNHALPVASWNPCVHFCRGLVLFFVVFQFYFSRFFILIVSAFGSILAKIRPVGFREGPFDPDLMCGGPANPVGKADGHSVSGLSVKVFQGLVFMLRCFRSHFFLD